MVWSKSDRQSNPERGNEVIAQWEHVFGAIDSGPHRVERLDAQKFYHLASLSLNPSLDRLVIDS